MDAGIGTLIARLAETNIEIWHQEERARDDDDHRVAAAKRTIDRLNQRRNDLIEQIDDAVASLMARSRSEGGRG
ncbi:MAG TPA: DUF4254 domain-containing protein [Gemmatimonadaceae bacterium]|nr:DUF4254 domain-containing protein [Gemmatimonadaceae bacterium]